MSLQFEAVSHQFGRKTALVDVSLHVRAGDCYGLIGHNGAGKTTAIRIALGLERCRRGRVLVDGYDAVLQPRAARARVGGLVETPGFDGGVSGAHNLTRLARLQGIAPRDVRPEVARVLDLVALDEGGKPVRNYSQGMRQRLGLAQALLGRPEYLLLDEPMNGLDPEGIVALRDLLRRLVTDEATTVLLSSHQLQEVASLCNRIGIQKEGRLLLEAETSELLDASGRRYELEAAGPESAAAVLDGLGIAHERAGDRLWLELGTREPDAVVDGLVRGGVRVRAFTPEPATLEQVYMGIDAGERRPPTPEPVEVRGGASRVSAAAVLRVVRYELQRMSWRMRAALVLPGVVLGTGAVWARRNRARGYEEEVGDTSLASTTDVTAFDGVAVALQGGLPVLLCIVAGMASQSVAGEVGQGTLRNVLLRPLLRTEVAAGKTLGVLAATFAAALCLLAGALAAGAWFFDFRDVVELLPGGRKFPLIAAAELWPELVSALFLPLLALAAYAGVGFLAGSIVRGAAGALALAVSSVVFLDLLRVIARGAGFEALLPSTYLPSPLGDTSLVQYFADSARGVSNAAFDHAGTQVVVPAAWGAATFVLAAIAISRKSVR